MTRARHLIAALSLCSGSALAEPVVVESVRVDAAEREPNDAWASANVLGTRAVSGVFDGDDHLLFDVVRPASASTVQRVTLTPKGARQDISLCLFDVADHPRERQCRRGHDSTLVLSDLALAPGRHGLRVQGRGGRWSLRIEDTPAEAEREPNDTRADAITIGADAMLAGELSPHDVDVYRIVLAHPGIYNVEMATPKRNSIAWLDARDELMRDHSRLIGLPLSIGEHFIALSGTGPYVLVVHRNGDAMAGELEREPNDARGPERLAFGRARAGFISALDDEDVYSLTLPAPVADARLNITSAMRLVVSWQIGGAHEVRVVTPAEPLVLTGPWPAGDHVLELFGGELGAYQITLTGTETQP